MQLLQLLLESDPRRRPAASALLVSHAKLLSGKEFDKFSSVVSATPSMRIYQSNLSVQSHGGVPDLKDYRSVPAGNQQPPRYVPDEPDEEDEDFGDSHLFEPDGVEEQEYGSDQGEEEQEPEEHVSGQENRADMPSIQVERIQNVAGSTAGAGSADYYAYRNRRRDALAQENLQEREQILTAEQKLFEAKIVSERNNLAQKQKKRKDKRLKKKQNKATTKLAKRLNKFKNDGSFLAQVEGEENLGKRADEGESGSDSDQEDSEDDVESGQVQKGQAATNAVVSDPKTQPRAQTLKRETESPEVIELGAEKRQKTS